MATPHSLTHEWTSPQCNTRSIDTHPHTRHSSRIPSGPLSQERDMHTCQNTMWTAQTEHWWEHTYNHYTHYTHYTANFSLSLRFNFFIHVLSFPFLSFRLFPLPFTSLLPLSMTTSFIFLISPAAQPAGQTGVTQQSTHLHNESEFDEFN